MTVMTRRSYRLLLPLMIIASTLGVISAMAG
jgi:hypothetical protein